ncbi:MAG: PAS domain S-box protein [Deltaproteobacteria bacterium]|nr:PAS domain S-box protein [Deltaproteobacteria bacterium]
MLARVAAAPDDAAGAIAEHPEPLFVFNADRRILAANPPAEHFFGYARGDLDGRSVEAIVPVRVRHPDAPPMRATDVLTTVEMPGLCRDGREPQLSMTFGAVATAGEPLFVLIVRDRAAIEDALEGLYTSEQRFRLLVDGVRDHAVLLLDTDGRIATWNSGAERIYGWRADDIIGQPWEMFFPREDRCAGIPPKVLTAAAAEGYMHAAGWRVRKDGTRFFAETSLWPLFAQDGAVQGFAKVTHDLTSKRAAEETQLRLGIERAAREAAEAGRDRLARLHRAAQALSRATTPAEVAASILHECLAELDAVAGAVLLRSHDGATLAPSGRSPAFPGTLASIPVDSPTPAGDAIRTLQPLFFESADAFVARYPQLAPAIREGGFQASVALPLIARDTALGVLAAHYGEPHAFTEDDRSLFLTMAELCAQALERARLFEAQMAARTQAEAASRAKDEFLAMLGHELRNPLAPIATAIELMKLRGETHSLREREVIERQLGHISHLVDDLLDIARITRGKLELALRPVDVADAIARAVEMASPLLEQYHHKLTMRVPRGLVVQADPARLAQVISNLLTNAAKYTRPNGQIDVDAAAVGADVVVHVRDNGQGIDPELLPHVFDLFIQGKRSFDRAEGGLGIGLALVKNLVTLHGGGVTVTSTLGAGSEFVVRLPSYAQAALGPHGDPAHAATPTNAKRVLVVDDNRDFAEMLASSLAALGYEVDMALDGVSALEHLRVFPAEAAVLDLGLPVLDGFELARKIREQFAGRMPRLIAVTGYGQQHDRERTADVGFADHLVKPIDIKEMVAAIERPEL